MSTTTQSKLGTVFALVATSLDLLGPTVEAVKQLDEEQSKVLWVAGSLLGDALKVLEQLNEGDLL